MSAFKFSGHECNCFLCCQARARRAAKLGETLPENPRVDSKTVGWFLAFLAVLFVVGLAFSLAALA